MKYVAIIILVLLPSLCIAQKSTKRFNSHDLVSALPVLPISPKSLMKFYAKDSDECSVIELDDKRPAIRVVGNWNIFGHAVDTLIFVRALTGNHHRVEFNIDLEDLSEQIRFELAVSKTLGYRVEHVEPSNHRVHPYFSTSFKNGWLSAGYTEVSVQTDDGDPVLHTLWPRIQANVSLIILN